VLFSRAEGLEQEQLEMGRLCQRLKNMPRPQGPGDKKEAMELIGKLRSMNQRWNIPELGDFIKERAKALFF
jgi:hypothetical protein